MIKKGKFADILRGIIDRNPDGKLLSGLEAELVQAVFECHPKSRQKAGAGVVGFIVETDSRRGTTRHFSVLRIDGSKEDFSWQTCLDGKLPSQKTDVMFALREAIADQTIAFKTRAFDGRPSIQCPLTGEGNSIQGSAGLQI